MQIDTNSKIAPALPKKVKNDVKGKTWIPVNCPLCDKINVEVCPISLYRKKTLVYCSEECQKIFQEKIKGEKQQLNNINI